MNDSTHDAEPADGAVEYLVELVDGPAEGEHRTITTAETWPEAMVDVEIGDGQHVVYLYVGRRGDIDPSAWAYGWDRQQPTTTASAQPAV